MHNYSFRNIALAAFMLLMSFTGSTAAVKRGFAIVIDPASLREANAEVKDYAKAIEDVNGLRVFIVEDKWGVPDSIRATLRRMHAQKDYPIEGTVLVGDIPVAMLRDAQHLTSAFKMNQKADRRDSSVPSDRYYDDFGLLFTPLGRDSVKPYFYYSLRADSRQSVRPDIYSGRIRPTDAGGTSRYAKLRAYLSKAVAEKRAPRTIRQVLYFNGHGYVSGSLMARIDEKAGLYEHFPWLLGQKNAIGYISHDQQDVTKFLLMNELQRPDLDYAILHHHGAPDTQYMDGTPRIQTAERAKQFIQEYCRGYLRHYVEDRGQNKDTVMAALMKRFDIPASWLSNTFDPDVVRKDSTADANEDITIGDFREYGYKPNCRVVMIDACFTGSFHLDDCIADEYIFNPGRTVAVIANSVNVLQDKWSDRYMGLLGLGAPVGFLPRVSGYLESQVIGDPTYTFAPAAEVADVPALLASSDYKVWGKYLKNEQYPDLRSVAIERYAEAGHLTPAELLEIFRTSRSALVRVEALTALSTTHSDEFVKAIALGTQDSYELVQRFALNYLGKSGDMRLIPALIRIAITNNTSERCNFSAKNALGMFPLDKLMSEFERQFNSDSVCYINKADVKRQIAHAIESNATKWLESVDMAVSDTVKPKIRMREIRTTRNYCPPFLAQKLMDAVRASRDSDVQKALIESLGWRDCSYMAPRIAAFALEISKDASFAPEVRDEALKTYNRVK